MLTREPRGGVLREHAGCSSQGLAVVDTRTGPDRCYGMSPLASWSAAALTPRSASSCSRTVRAASR
jgi:hypothetical protein